MKLTTYLHVNDCLAQCLQVSCNHLISFFVPMDLKKYPLFINVLMIKPSEA